PHLFILRIRRPPGPTLFPYTTLFRSTQDLQVLSDAEYSKNVHARIAPPVKEAIAGRDNSALAIKPAKGNAEGGASGTAVAAAMRSEEHTSELQSRFDLVCRLLLEKKK